MQNHALVQRLKRSLRTRSSRTSLARWACCILLGLPLLALLALVVATLVPRIPHLTSMGTGLLATYTAWFVLIPGLLALALLGLWLRLRFRAFLLLSVLGLLCAAGAAAVLARMHQVAVANGVKIDPRLLLALRHVSDTATPDETVAYGRDDAGMALEAAIYRPRDTTRSLSPVLLYVHGGGWISGSKLDRSADMRWFADQGWLVISADYVLASAGRPRWDKTGGEIACALAWVGANAPRFGGDAARLSMFGDSAGGSLVLNAAYQANADTLRSSCGTLPRVAAVVALYPVVDPAGFDRNPDPHAGHIARLMAERYFGGPASQFPERYRQLASLQFVSGAAPPTLIIVGDIDSLVPPAPTYAFADTARALGVPVRLLRMPYGQHAFDIIAGNLGNQVMRQATAQHLTQAGQAPKR